MSVLEPIRAGIQGFILALQDKIDTADPQTGVVQITTVDLEKVVAALKQAETSLPTSLPFGI